MALVRHRRLFTWLIEHASTKHTIMLHSKAIPPKPRTALMQPVIWNINSSPHHYDLQRSRERNALKTYIVGKRENAINPLPDDNILDRSILKQIADDNLKCI